MKQTSLTTHRYDRNVNAAIGRGERHGQSGHLNVSVLDQNSPVTGFGAHARVVAFLPDIEGLYCRADLVHGLPEPTTEQVLTIARVDQGIKGKWRLRTRVQWQCGSHESIDYHFDRVTA